MAQFFLFLPLHHPPFPLITVLGPTGSGKSELALALAERFAGEIIGCDSVQVYRRLNIGSAKLSPSERRGICHHLIDVIDVDQELTAGAYSRLARQALTTIQARQRFPIVTGGTGFYLRALLDGLSPAPPKNAALRQRLTLLSARRPAALHRFLSRFDPTAAARIHRNDHQKLIRAIELTLLARRPATQTQAQPRQPLAGIQALKIGLAPDRALLYERLNQRCIYMFEHGLLTETRALLDAAYPPPIKPLQSLGYKQAAKYLKGDLPYNEALSECQTKTRQYAKRQITWFRKEPDVHWLQGFGSEPAIQQQAIAKVQTLLAL